MRDNKPKSTKVCYIDPVSSAEFLPDLAAYFSTFKNEDCHLEVINLRAGLPWDNLEYHSFEALVSADLVKAVYWASTQGFDAVIIGCFYDLCLHECREVAGDMIVVAPCQASLQVASNISNRTSIIIGQNKWRHKIESNVRYYGQHHLVGSLVPCHKSVNNYLDDKESSQQALIRASQYAIQNDYAESIILGCSANLGMYKTLQSTLGIPVIDPVLAALSLAQCMAKTKHLGWGTSHNTSLEAPWQQEPEAIKYFSTARNSIGERLVVE